MATNALWARPLYLQLRDALVERIAAGDWKPGAQIPNEGELACEFGVSAGTMRKALDLMEGERLVTRRQGAAHSSMTKGPMCLMPISA